MSAGQKLDTELADKLVGGLTAIVSPSPAIKKQWKETVGTKFKHISTARGSAGHDRNQNIMLGMPQVEKFKGLHDV